MNPINSCWKRNTLSNIISWISYDWFKTGWDWFTFHLSLWCQEHFGDLDKQDYDENMD